MATRPFTADDSADAVSSADGAGAGAGRLNHHQLTVLTTSMAEVVRLAGGWLFDRSRAGWDVSVLVGDRGDDRPLAILGVTPLDGDCDSIVRSVPRDGSIAVSAELLRIDAAVRAHILELVRSGDGEVTVWGQGWPVELGERIEPTEHQLSVAARAFKARALSAARLGRDGVEPTETLFDLRADVLRPLYPV